MFKEQTAWKTLSEKAQSTYHKYINGMGFFFLIHLFMTTSFMIRGYLAKCVTDLNMSVKRLVNFVIIYAPDTLNSKY